MTKHFTLLTFCVIAFFHENLAQNRYWIAVGSGSWNNTANWSTTSGGLGGASVPGAGNVAIFDGGLGLSNGNCTLDIAPTVGGLTMNGYGGTIDLNGSTLTSTGTNTFTTGTITNSGASASLDLNTAGTSTFGGTAMQADVTGSSGRIFFNGSVFTGTVTLTKTGTATDDGIGNNTFNSAVTLTNSSTGALRMGTVTRDIFNQDITIVINGGDISIARASANNQFNGNIAIDYQTADAAAIGFAGGTSTLASTKTISATCGATGCGNLTLAGLTQSGAATAQSIVLSGNNAATLTIGPGSTFNGALTVSSPSIILNSSTFQNTTQLTKTGTNTDNLRGGNIFNGVLTVNNQGGDLVFGSNTADAGDTWNADATFNNTGGHRIRISEETDGNVFNASATFNALGATDVNSRIQISRLAGGETTFNGTVTLLNNGLNSDIHISYDAGTVTTFNGPVMFTSSAAGAENYFGVDGTVVFAGNIEFNSTSTSSIYFSQSTGTTTFGNGTISIGAGGFASGQIRFRNFTQTGTSAQNLTLTGTATLRFGPSATFNGDVDFRAPQIYLEGITTNGAARIEKTGATDNNSVGGDDFNGVTVIANSGSGSFELANTNPVRFDNDLTIENTGTNRIQIGINSAGNIFNGDVTINHGGANAFSTNTIIARNTGSTASINGDLILNCTNTSTASGIIIGNDGNVSISGNITVSSTNGRGVYFSNGTGAVTLADGFTITATPGTFTTGTLLLKSFTQTGNTAQNITLTGTADLTVGPSSTFNGQVNFITPQIHLDGCTFNNTTYLEKTGAADNTGSGSNIFNGITTIVNSGSGDFISGNSSNDAFNNDLTLTNSGSADIRMAENSAGNTFNGNITVNATSGTGIYFGSSGGATVTLASGRAITVGGLGFSSGRLGLRRFTQLGNAAQNLTLSGTAILTVGPSSIFNGDVNFVAPRFELDGCTFENTTYLEKTGASNDVGDGGNTFRGVTTIVNSGSGYLLSANVTPDTFDNQLTVTNTGTSTIYMAHNVPGSVFNGDIIVNSTSGGGVAFCNNSAATATLANGRTIFIGGLGFSSGELRLQRFTQAGTTAQNLTLTGTALLRLGPSTTFNGDVVFTAPRVLLNGTTYNGTVSITKNGASDDAGTGANLFAGPTQLTNSGSGYLLSAANSPDTFNGELTLINTGTSTIYMGYNSAGTQFNQNVNVSNSGVGIFFSTGASGSSVLANGRTITANSFASGELRLIRFTQSGTTSQTLTLTGTAVLRIGTGTVFNGALTASSPSVHLEGGAFNGVTSITKTGTSNNTNAGGNTFNNTTTLTNNATGTWRMSNTTGDTFNADVTFVKANTGAVDPSYTVTSTFNANMTINSSTTLTFGGNGGSVQFSGGNSQSVNKTGGTPSPVFQRMILNKSANAVTLNTDITVGVTATFTSGVLNTSLTNYLNFADNATTSGASNSSYVDGPVRKTGNDTFTFPVGDNNFYQPISISAPSNTTHHFTAQYFNAKQTYGGPSTYDPTFWTVNGCEYWTLDRTNGTSNVTVTLSWNESACGSPPGFITNPADLRVARWNGTSWVSHGNGGTTGSNASGTIVSSAAITSFSPFALASATPANPLPIELKKFWASDIGSTVTLNWITASEKNNHYFTVERSGNGIDFSDLGRINSKGDSKTDIYYALIDEAPLKGKSYYRLKQTDFDGQSETFNIILIERGGEIPFTVHPNPAGSEIIFLSEKSNIVIFNTLNQLVAEFFEVESFDAGILASGAYIIKTQQGQFTRFVKK